MITSEVILNRLNGNTRRIREKHTDIAGDIHIKSYDCDINADVTALLTQHASDIDIHLVDNELSQYINSIENGSNPFRDASNNPIDPIFNTRTEMLSKVLNKVLSTSDPVLFMSGAPYMSNLTDSDLIALLGIDQAKVDEIRAKVLSISDTANFLSGYVPPLGVV